MRPLPALAAGIGLLAAASAAAAAFPEEEGSFAFTGECRAATAAGNDVSEYCANGLIVERLPGGGAEFSTFDERGVLTVFVGAEDASTPAPPGERRFTVTSVVTRMADAPDFRRDAEASLGSCVLRDLAGGAAELTCEAATAWRGFSVKFVTDGQPPQQIG